MHQYSIILSFNSPSSYKCRYYSISFSDIHDRFDILDELDNVSHKWQSLGEALRLHPSVLDRIECDQLDSESRLRKVMTEWLNQAYETDRFGLPSWKLLVDAVAHRRGGNNPALARQIATKHNGMCIHVHSLYYMYV